MVMEPVEFDVSLHPASVGYAGDTTGVLAAGEQLKIETSPHGEELLDYEVPAGKTAKVRVYVSIVEIDEQGD